MGVMNLASLTRQEKNVTKRFLLVSLIALCAACSSTGGSSLRRDGRSEAGTDSRATRDGGSGGDFDPDSGEPIAQPDDDASIPEDEFPNGESDASATGPSVDKACSEYAQATCDRFSECASYGMNVYYGDEATCAKRTKLECINTLKLPGTSFTTSKASTCSTSLSNATCADIAAKRVKGCDPGPGALGDGAKCAGDSQCKSQFCVRQDGASCGVCSPATRAGGLCTSGRCSSGQVCTDDNTCIVPSRKIGETCKYFQECDLLRGVGCDTLLTRKCIQLETASTGQKCGQDMARATYVSCVATGACVNNVCVAAAADSAACTDTANGPYCMPPAVCISNKCKLPDGQACR